MCGIAGKLDRSGPVDRSLIERMCSRIVHRGPDSEGIFTADGVGIGMRRLAIIDVAGGQQPIYNEDRSIVAVMNGEIYNFRQLRADLERAGHSFRSHSDAEVLVHLYEEHGRNLCELLDGMFAFAIWDSRSRELLLARDRVGKKPLFWSHDGDRFWFASEIGALLADRDVDRAVDPDAIASFLAYKFVPAPMSAFASISKLPPGSTMTVSDRGMEVERYWRIEYDRSLESTPVGERREMLMDLLRSAVRKRLMSEVPLGAFLSGGIDSSAVVGLMAEMSNNPVKTFSIDFETDGFSEMPWADEVATRFGTEHHRFTTRPEAMELLPVMVKHYGEPFADPAALPTFQLSRLTRQHVTVALNGDGGDESFAGYDHHLGTGGYFPGRFRKPWLFDGPIGKALARGIRLGSPLADRSSERSVSARAMRLAEMIGMSPPERYATERQAFRRHQRESWFKPEFMDRIAGYDVEGVFSDLWGIRGREGELDSMLGIDVDVVLSGMMLPKVDIATMASSLEGRSPFLDHHLMEFAARLPDGDKVREGKGKAILIDSLRGLVPDSVLDRPKMGFSVPLEHWFREESKEFARDVLLAPDSSVSDYVRRESIEMMLDEHAAGTGEHSIRIWSMLQLEFWHREVVSAPGSATD